MKEQLKSRPFCGNSSTSPHNLQSIRIIREKHAGIFGAKEPYTIFYVKCHKCFAQAGCGVTGYNGLTGTTTTAAQARKIAVAKWNRRTESMRDIEKCSNQTNIE